MFGLSGPTGPVIGPPIGPSVIRDATVTQLTMSDDMTGAANRHQMTVQVTVSDPNGNAILTFGTNEVPKPLQLGQKVKLVFGLQVRQT